MNSVRLITKQHPIISLIESDSTFKELKKIHSQLLLNGLHLDPHLLGQFVATPSKSPTPQKSFHLFNIILQSTHNVSPDSHTFNFLVRACAQLLARETGPAVHVALVKHGFERDPHIQSGLIFMYAELDCLSSCHRVFEQIREPDLVCQTAMIGACAKHGDIGFARELFNLMTVRDPIAWNAMIAGDAQLCEVYMVSVLSACTHLGAFDQGRWAHVYIERNKLRVTVTLGTALIDMYAKCGNMNKAMEVFCRMKEKNVYTWTSAMGGLAMNGFGEKCLELFSLMKQDGVLPDAVTFVSVLRVCSLVGLVEEGHVHFESMSRVYGIEPQLEHYGCMGLDEALNFINSMPVKPHSGAWGAFLNACRMYKNTELGELASRKIVELEAKNHGAFVALSNMYADSKNWEKVSSLRDIMKAKGVRKLPGCSVIEVGGEVHEFFVGDKSHPMYDEIEMKLAEISKWLKLSEEEEKEDTLCKHSEKVAIAFGLMALKEGVPIRIVKNLRVCWDCHEVTKMISKTFNREIVMRDRNRRHHFKDGDCSCKGYW
ncbi:hypothetical protein I3842_10G036400 [Carya illinoinensis]|uniref:DYW domain-containing protein n=1 Tax=Carya illinoinensis TaxID=32201 RepID=A0A922DV84_CARIL|nr:hypothetical protein I3842_10G036400 [Carya illinoinensis]